jgi:hypothetical protein
MRLSKEMLILSMEILLNKDTPGVGGLFLEHMRVRVSQIDPYAQSFTIGAFFLKRSSLIIGHTR